MNRLKRHDCSHAAHTFFKRISLLLIAASLAAALASCTGGGDVDETTGEVTEALTETDEVTTKYDDGIDDDADTVDGIAIYSAEDLAKIGVDDDYPLDGDYVLVADIDLTEYNWTPIGDCTESGAYKGDGVFSGTFDGRGHIIRGLTIDESSGSDIYWGLFGTVGSSKKSDPAVIENIIFSGVSIDVSTSGGAVGTLAGQVSCYVTINNISLLSGSVNNDGSGGSLGCGGLIGQCRTTVTGVRSNECITITNIFSNVTVTQTNSSWDTCGGIIGRIRESNIGTLTNILLTAPVTFENTLASAIASGDATANTYENLYFKTNTGKKRDGLGSSVSTSVLTGGGMSFSDSWTVEEGSYPLLTTMLESDGYSIFEFILFEFASGETISSVKTSFTVSTSVLGADVTWTSGDSEYLAVSDDGTVTATRPADSYVDVTLTAEIDGETNDFVVRVLAVPLEGSFKTTYVVADEPIELEGYDDAEEITWEIYRVAADKTVTKTTTEPSITLSSTYEESIITVKADGHDDISIYFSSLPVVYITSETDYSSVRQAVYSEAEMTVCASEDYDISGLYSGGIKIKVRGNSTATLDKRPFKIKLDDKSNLLGMDDGENKHWCLLANARDATLMRNILLNQFAADIGTETVINSENVVLIYNGEYYGVYQLCEQIRVDETRVDIFDWEEYAKDAAEAIALALRESGSLSYAEAATLADALEEEMLEDWSWMDNGYVTYNGTKYVFTDYGLDELPDATGGFLMEMDFYSMYANDYVKTFTAYQQPIYFNTPTAETAASRNSLYGTELYSYAYKYIQSFEYALHSDDFVFKNSDTHYEAVVNSRYNYHYVEVDYTDDLNDGLHYSELFDMDSLVNNFIFCEIAMNWDSMKNSFFFYKDIDGLAKIGPQWDFDWAWGNILWNGATWEPTQWHTTCTSFMIEQYYQEEQWNCLLIRDPYFITKVYERWTELRDEEIENLVGAGGLIDEYADYIEKAALANDAKWSYLTYYYTYKTELARMKEFIEIRMDWLDSQFADIDTLVSSLGVYYASDDITFESVNLASSTLTVTVTVDSDDIDYIMFQINGTTMEEVTVKNGKATLTLDVSGIDTDGYNCITAYAEDSSHNYIYDSAHSDEGNYMQVVSNYYVFQN
ncbi:MAG: CotH kinase family protein [Clostridia bacterium]|nr:CotH kinase family protein [Clostridia bacterium]